MSKVSRIKATKNLKKDIKSAVDEIGGFSKFIKKGDAVLIKPNFNTADPPPASTDVDFLRHVVELVYDAGAKAVIVGDSSTMMLNTRKVMEEKKVFDLDKNMKYPPRIIVFEERKWNVKKIKNGKYLKTISVPESLEKVDKLILLPCCKTHMYAGYTGALKISVGFMKPVERVRLHMGHLQEKVAELNTVIHPDLIIMDARKCFITKGPAKGEVREPGLIFASTSRVDIDIEGIKTIQKYEGNSLAGIKPEELTQIKLAKKIGIK
ncbi:MAG TPA: DUF362 domain-containing protein [Patescibacteria group bacterium]|nr:DUF362 domain-containing protein [Patescibacteria group bacterium]